MRQRGSFIWGAGRFRQAYHKLKEDTPSEAQAKMKRAIVLLVMLLLLIDLGQDGCLGKAVLVSPDSSAPTSLTSPPQYEAGKADCHHKLSLTNCGVMSGCWPCQPVTLRVQPTLQVITFCHTNSSGAIPL
jgi:hypothetical protein